jgi:hypothetical protein
MEPYRSDVDITAINFPMINISPPKWNWAVHPWNSR